MSGGAGARCSEPLSGGGDEGLDKASEERDGRLVASVNDESGVEVSGVLIDGLEKSADGAVDTAL